MYFTFRIRVPMFLGQFFLWLYRVYQKIRYGQTVRFIPLSNGRFAIVDLADYENLMRCKWHTKGCSDYAVRIENRKRIYMHNEIMQLTEGFNSAQDKCAQGGLRVVVDHKDHNSLNNTRGNLRIATKTQNSYNQKKRIGRTSKYKGVYLDQKGYWRAKIRFDGRVICLGQHKKEEDAARAYDAMAKKLHGEFAVLNFP
jgi:hypothetical protein